MEVNSAKPDQLSDKEILEAIEQEDEDKYLTFSLDNQLFGIEILQIREIIKPISVTRLPNAPVYILGVVNLRGEIIPIVDIKKRFGLEKIQFTSNTRIIVVEIKGKYVGLYVEEVNHVEPIKASDIEVPQEDIAGVSVNFFSGYKTIKDNILLLLELENLIAEVEIK
jgi:purine-binding chemotaxis protein CheW